MFVRREAVLSSQIEGTQSSLRDLLRAEANVAVKQASKFLGIGYAAANRLVDRMVERDILVEVTGNARNRRFACQRYIALFDD